MEEAEPLDPKAPTDRLEEGVLAPSVARLAPEQGVQSTLELEISSEAGAAVGVSGVVSTAISVVVVDVVVINSPVRGIFLLLILVGSSASNSAPLSIYSN